MKLPRKPHANEGELQRWFVKELKKFGCLVYKFASPAKRGVPDLMIIEISGDVYFVEMKHPNGKGKLSPLQKVQIRIMLDQGCDVYTAASCQDCIDIVNGDKDTVNYAEL